MKMAIQHLAKDLVCGFVIGILVTIAAVTLASLIFNGDLSQYLLIGASTGIFGSIIIIFIVALGSSSKITISSPQDIFAAIAAIVASQIAHALVKNNPQDMLASVTYIWLLPALSIGFLALYLVTTAFIYRRQPFIVNTIMSASTYGSVFLFVATVNILGKVLGWV